MGAYNTVDVQRLTPCPRCGDTGLIAVQFAYGNTQQLHYALGDAIKWGGNDVGTQADGQILLLGTPEHCRTCGLDVPEEYVIIIDHGLLCGYRIATRDEVARLP